MTTANNRLTPKQLHFLQHALGCDQYGRGSFYRNRFVTDEDGQDGQICLQLVAMGYMKNAGRLSISGGSSGSSVFFVTDQGKEVMRSESPSPPKVSWSKQRYIDYLRSDCDMSFGEWLKQKDVP